MAQYDRGLIYNMTCDQFVERAACPACGHTQFHEIYQNLFTADPIREYLLRFYNPQGNFEPDVLQDCDYVLDECDRCGLIFQRFIANNDLMTTLYEQWLDPQIDFDANQQQHNLAYYVGISQEIMMVIDYFKRRPSELVFFDFGMGWGSWARLAKAMGCESYGHDLSGQRVTYAQQHGVKVINWDQIPEHGFDFINTEQVFEHIPKPLETLSYLKQALKPNGLIKISVPNGKNIKEKLAIGDWKAPKGSPNSLNAIAPLEHINCFVHESIIQMAREAGLKPVRLPLLLHYRYMAGWRLNRNLLKGLGRPVLHRFRPGTYVFLTAH